MAKHVWKKNDDGTIDTFAYSYEHHNGPVCLVCGREFCEHCTPECYDQECYYADETNP